ncbi:hypothetical protein L829_2637 [Mycobacteroides abscessus MAB_030201_1075]|uniref:Uncharacterized protein n=1 Tax=Mycobacteroides abscessus MAB_030201_1075 TaxID=1335410 RepID=A0A829PPG2_9MYCO|nr:hypothetical protein MM1S1510930_1905 [Mycobacteroides abscessus subsp. bolletii 1S-151-0930]EIU77020.1 hypothetical protein MM1S1530915_1455 [Mycobacteroides abscessus subsp. bolletii 1S-153-0915]EIV55695.1 hypothetical protein MA3A0930S_1706 [Mycobacteroides abscessus 3A-0930-S]ETZ89063.1 hypothetical protein L829_2637 [Mycobacteroides abscessus MAB_030201_1075]
MQQIQSRDVKIDRGAGPASFLHDHGVGQGVAGVTITLR